MPDTVPVTLEFDPETAAALDDPATRARIERLILRTIRPAGIEQLFATIAIQGWTTSAAARLLKLKADRAPEQRVQQR